MTLLSLLGVDTTVHKTSEEVQMAVGKAILELQPLFQQVENRFGGIVHGLMDRVKVNINIEIVPISKAEIANISGQS